MFISIINDCRDGNAMNRQAVRAASLFSAPITTVGVSTDIEAAGNIIDALDAAGNEKGIILANVAPRHGKAKKWPNGTPFGYFQYKNMTVFATVDGLTLSLAKKYGIADTVHVFDIPTVMASLVQDGEISQALANQIIDTQFRSFEFLPRVAKWHADGKNLPTEALSTSELFSAPHAVWWVDNFGNCKTTVWSNEIDYREGGSMQTKFGEIKCYYRLKDVPNDEPGLIVGSSGLDDRRFVELVVQGKSAADRFGIQAGDTLL